ncbi:MAG: hypothetical protein ABSA26_00370 [Thermoguttaceae bacterium]
MNKRICGMMGLLAMTLTVAWGQTSQPEDNALLEEKLGAIPPTIVDVVFSKDGCHVAFVFERNKKSLVMVDGREGTEYEEIGKGSLVFSPGVDHSAYVAINCINMFLVADGREGSQYDVISEG